MLPCTYEKVKWSSRTILSIALSSCKILQTSTRTSSIVTEFVILCMQSSTYNIRNDGVFLHLFKNLIDNLIIHMLANVRLHDLCAHQNSNSLKSCTCEGKLYRYFTRPWESDFSLAPLLLTRLPRAPSRRNVIQYTRKCWYLLISMNACKRHFKLMEEGSTLIISTWLRCVFIMRPAFPLDFGSPYVVLSYYFKSISRRPILGTTSSHVASPWISVRGQRASPSSS